MEPHRHGKGEAWLCVVSGECAAEGTRRERSLCRVRGRGSAQNFTKRTDCAIVVHENELHQNIVNDYGGLLDDVSHWEALMMDCRSEVRRHSFLQQNPKFTEIFSPRASRSSKPREKDKAPQRHVVAQVTDGRSSFPPKVPGNYRKLWPSKVSMGTEELVKHMSNVPIYLQRTERGHNFQVKALNFGVLDWQRLEKWTDNHRWGTEHGYASGSPASSNASSPFTTFGSSSQSCRSSASSYLNQKNQSPSVLCHQDPSTEDEQTPLSEGASRINNNDIACRPPEIAPRKCPVRHHISFSVERCPRMDSLTASYEENKRKGPDSASASDNLRSSFGASTLLPRSKNREKMKSHDFGSVFKETSGDLRHVCHSTSPFAGQYCPENHCTGHFRLDHGMLDHVEDSFQGNRRFSFVSPRNSATPIEPGRASFVGTFSSKDHQFSHLSLNVPHWCPLASDIHGNGSLDMRPSSDLGGRTVPFDSIRSSQCSDEVAMVRSNGCYRKHEKYATKLQKDIACETPGRLHRIGIKALTRGRESEPNNQSYTDLIGSSSLRENSHAKQGKWTPLSSQNPERETDISKSRRSPLRRLLDPLLKPKAFNLSHAAELTVGTPRPSSYERKLPTEENLASNQEPQSLFRTTPRSSISDTVKESTPSCIPAENQSSSYGGKCEVSSRQGVLQVSWKNGLPFFTFSLNESDILAATWKRGTSSKEDYECIYTFYYICEIKKKIGGWISQGNKSKRKELVTNAIGQMNVSCLKCPRNHFIVREFVLFGPELRPTACETLDPVPNSELAAIVLRVPEGSTESFIDNLPHINNIGHQLKSSLETNRHAYSPGGSSVSGQILEKNSPKMVAILPSEVHGLSDTGKPATLVERWKSGGLCDCGGWDAGCSLKILTNNLLHSMSGGLQFCNTFDGTCRVELFIQGEGQERKPLFRLVTFDEGLYTVNFDASIEVLQAFSVCIAILHGKKPKDPCELQGPRLCKSMDCCVVKNPAGKQVGSSISMPHHPPLSPVGRA